jgi:hypothetical protein
MHPPTPPDEPASELIERVAAELRGPVALSPDFQARVMARVRRRSRLRLLDWLVEPRLVPVSPLAGFAAAAVLVVIVGLTATVIDRVASGRASPSAVAGPPLASKDVQVVRFVLAAPGAAQVALVGDFNGWDTTVTPLRPIGAGGVWFVEVPLTRGHHEYAFVVDGREWRPDPAAPRAASENFGQPSSVIMVGARAS